MFIFVTKKISFEIYYFQFERTTNKTVVCMIKRSCFSDFEDCCFLPTTSLVLSRDDVVTAVPCFQKHEKFLPHGYFGIGTELLANTAVF